MLVSITASLGAPMQHPSLQHPRLQKVLFFLALLCTLLPRVAVAQASKVILTFYMLTASHAALGAPMQYQLTQQKLHELEFPDF